METLVHLDTHVAILLYKGDVSRFSNKCIHLLEDNPLCISQIVRLEIKYLFEIGRIKQPPSEIIDKLQHEIGLVISPNNYENIIDNAIRVDFTRDPFDRIIVADADLNQSLLVSLDRHIQINYRNTLS